MNPKAPRFELTRVFSDGEQGTPEIVPITCMLWETKADRRGFLTGIGASMLLMLLKGQSAASALPLQQSSGRPFSAAGANSPDCGGGFAHSNFIGALAISPDGTLLASGGGDNAIKLWSLPGGALLKTLQSHTNSVSSLAISPDGKLLASGSADKTIKLWSLPEGVLLKTVQGLFNFPVNALTISPDGMLLASGTASSTIKLYSLPEGANIKTLEGHAYSVRSLAISPDGKLLASGSDDKTIKLWSLPDGEFKTCALDLAASPSTSKGITYTTRSSSGQTVTYTLPCGSPIPPGAVCTCNCVPGSLYTPTYTPPPTYTPTPTYTPPQSGTAPCGTPIPPGAICTCNCV